jgi:hypothetical protein
MAHSDQSDAATRPSPPAKRIPASPGERPLSVLHGMAEVTMLTRVTAFDLDDALLLMTVVFILIIAGVFVP